MPAPNHLCGIPLMRTGCINMQDYVVVIGHYRIRAEIDCKYLVQPQQFIFQPLLAMIKVLASEPILTKKETSTYGSYTDVIVRGGLQRDQRLSGSGHCVTPVTAYC